MLTRQELTLIQAALQFWKEEMDLEDLKLLATYAGDPLVDRIWKREEIQQLQRQLLSAQLRYVVCDAEKTKLQNQDFFLTLTAAKQALTEDSDQIGTLLIVDPTI